MRMVVMIVMIITADSMTRQVMVMVAASAILIVEITVLVNIVTARAVTVLPSEILMNAHIATSPASVRAVVTVLCAGGHCSQSEQRQCCKRNTNFERVFQCRFS
jgi:hypothetical protein